MVLLRFLGRLCAAGAENEAPAELCNKQAPSQTPPQQQPACQHDFALSSLHRLLSGLAGTSFQRIDGLLDALLRPEVTGATSVELYAVPEGENDDEELVLLASAWPSGKGATEARIPVNGTTHILPDPQQDVIFKQMFIEKAPIHTVLDRCPDAAAGDGSSDLPVAIFKQACSSPLTVAGKASCPRLPRPMRVAAVPLLHGSRLAGALWLEQTIDAAATATATTKAAAAGAAAVPLLSDPRALHSLGFACSMCMLGPEGSHAAWLAAALSRLAASSCMSALTATLCTAVAAHIRRRFVLESAVTAALVPPGPEAAPPLALLLQPSGPSAAAGGGGVSQYGHINNPNGGAAAGLDAARSVEALAERRGLSVGGKLSCRSPPVVRPTSSNVMLFAAQQLGTSPGTGAAGLGLGGGGAAAQSPHPELGGGLSTAASRRRLRALGGTLTHGLLRDQAALFHARFSLDLSPRQRALGPSVDIPRSPSLGPTAIGAGSSRSIVIPLISPPPNGGHGAADSSHAAATAAAAACCSGTTPTLHARAFPLHRTLLQAQLQQVRQPAAVIGGAVASAPESSARGGGVGSAGASAGMQAISAPAFSAVIEDTQLHVQSVHKPSGDVCMLMGLTRKTANGMLGGGGVGGGGGGAVGTPATYYHASGAVSATGMAGGSSFYGSSGAGGGGGGGGGFMLSGVGAVGGAVGVPQSLVLLGVPLGEGAALGLYLCFPRRLPGPLLEAVRASCQELMDKALSPVVRSKLLDPAIAPEYETLCCASPGSYAVVRSFCGSHLQPALLPPALSATYMSTATATGSDLASAMAAGGAMVELAGPAGAALAHTPPELLSGELSTADMDVLLALQAQQQQQAGGRGGPGQAADPSGKRGSANATRRSGQDRALAAASFVRRSIAAAAAAAGGGGGAAGGGPAGRAATQHLASPLSARSASAADRRTLTASSLGPIAASAGAGAAATAAAAAGGAGTAAGDGGGAAAGDGGGEYVEPLNLSQLLQSNPMDLLAAAQRTNSLRSLGVLDGGLAGGGGGGGGGFTAASIITVSGVDNAATARQQLGLLVSSIHATINTDPAAAGGASSSPLDDLDALELGDVLGQGGGGTVFKGRLGTLDVAVKLMELPKVDPAVDAAARKAPAAPQGGPTAAAASPPTAAAPGAAGGGGAGPSPTEAELAVVDKLCLNARREMLRNATELAVQSRVSHPNIVQIYATYNDVVMVSKKGPPGCPGSTYRLLPAVLNCGGPAGGEDAGAKERRHVPCVAAAFELCDCGSLGAVLAARTFPKAAYRERERDAEGAFPLRPQLVVDMKGVYMTLLDVALALRHLHALNLVHRDVKPANLLLKSNPRDPRGFTVKLADFGFVLHLSETAEDGGRYAVADQACGTVTHMAPEALLAKAKIDASVDMYAFGILMWEMFSGGVRPFPRLQPDKIPRAVYRGARPSFSEEVPAAYRSLALACWSTEPQRRPRATDVVCMLNGFLQELE